jgi:hypothetical protein
VTDRFGILGVQLNNLEDVYNPMLSGRGSMLDTRSHLIRKGMSSEFADSLAKKYINKLELISQESSNFNN